MPSSPYLLAAVAGFGLIGLSTPRADAVTIASPASLRAGLEAVNLIENVAFCFYEDGWNGPGFYECGFQRRQGQGWHGPRDGTTDRSGNHSGSGGGSTTTNTTTNTGDTTNNTGTGAGATTQRLVSKLDLAGIVTSIAALRNSFITPSHNRSGSRSPTLAAYVP
jgi:hypothetical protein